MLLDEGPLIIINFRPPEAGRPSVSGSGARRFCSLRVATLFNTLYNVLDMSRKDERDTNEILIVCSIVVIIILIIAGIGVLVEELAKLKDNSPIIFWLIIAGVIAGIAALLILGMRSLIKKKGQY